MEPVVDRFRDSMQLRLIRRANAGPASARNTGAAVAASPLLVFTDDDCEPEVEWLSALHAQSMEHPECLIGGQTINGLPDNVYAAASQLLIDYLYQYQASVSTHGERAAPAFFTANNFGVPAALFRRVGGFDESFPLAGGEDRELCDRWQHLGLGTGIGAIRARPSRPCAFAAQVLAAAPELRARRLAPAAGSAEARQAAVADRAVLVLLAPDHLPASRRVRSAGGSAHGLDVAVAAGEHDGIHVREVSPLVEFRQLLCHFYGKIHAVKDHRRRRPHRRPQGLRQALGLQPGQPLEIRAGDGRLEIEIAPTPMQLQKRGKGLVAVPDAPLPR